MASKAKGKPDEGEATDQGRLEIEEILDEVAPEEGEESGKGEGDGEGDGADEQPVAAKGDPSATESLPGGREGAGDAGASEGAPHGEAPSSDASPPVEDGEGASDVEVDDKAQRERDGLMKEIQKLRLKVAEADAERARAQQQQSAPTQPAAEPEAPSVPGLQVVVSEDGKSVYVPQDAVQKLIEERAAQIVDQKLKPTPEQIQQHQVAQATQGFIAEHGEKGQQIVERAHQAEELLTLRIQHLMAQGHQVGGVHDALSLIQQAGIAEEVAGYFPEIAAVGVDEFVEAMASGNPTWRKSLLSRMASAGVGAAPPPVPTNGNGAAPAPTLKSVEGSPPSLARRGGVRSEGPAGDQKEFEELQTRYTSDPVAGVSQAEWKRLVELGKKLGAPGYQEL